MHNFLGVSSIDYIKTYIVFYISKDVWDWAEILPIIEIELLFFLLHFFAKDLSASYKVLNH